MGISFGSLFASLTLESSSFMSGLDASRKALASTQKEFSRIGGNIAKVGAVMSAGLTAPLALIGSNGVAAAKDFGQSMANISTLVDTSRESIDAMGKSVLDISKRVPVQTADLTAALYDVRSAGIGAADAMSVLEGSAKLGVAGLGSTKEATDLVTSSINAFKLAGADQQKVYDNIFRTVKAGKTTISDLAQGFGAVVPVVAQSKIKLDEYLASVAALTTTGLPAAQAQTQIRAAIAGLTRDTKESAAVFAKLGAKDFKDLIQKSGGMVQAFAAIKGAVGGNDAQLLNLVGSIEGFNAIVGLTGANGKAFTDTLAGMRDGTDAVAEAVAKQAGTTVAKMQLMQNSMQANSVIIGQALEPVVTRIAGLVTKLAEAFGQLPGGVQTGIIAVLGIGAAIGPVVTSLGLMTVGFAKALPQLITFSKFMKATAIPAIIEFAVVMAPVLLPLAAIAGAIALVVAAVNHWDEIKAVAQRVVGYMGQLYQGVKVWLIDKLAAVWNGVTKRITDVGDAFHQLWDRVVGHSYIPDMVDAIGDHMARLDGNMVAPVKAATQTAAQAFADLAQRVQPLLDRLFPDQAKFIQFKKDMADLSAIAAAQKWTPAQLAEAQGRLRNDSRGASPDFTPEGITDPIVDTSVVDETGVLISDTWGKIGAANDNLGDSFAQTTRNITSSLQSLMGSIKSGDWLGALSGLADAFTQLAGGGLFGKKLQANASSFRSFGGGRVFGGPVMPNTDYLVGEDGPEILRMGGKSGSIVPNHQIGGPAVVQVHVAANDYFDARVGQVSGGVTASAVNGAQRNGAMRQRQSLL